MGQNSSIEWTEHTFNPWWGCVRVSPGCEACYAETWAKRYGYQVWGPAKTTERRLFGESHWSDPIRWHKQALKLGRRARVFCASMADVFEDHPHVVEARVRLWEVIEQTPMLDWLLLTKRPENILHMIPDMWELGGLPSNVWIGTSVENQEYADKRIPHLLKVPARVRFLSCEPLLSAVDLSPWLVFEGQHDKAEWMLSHHGRSQPLSWCIVGGESGPLARPMHPDWARSLRDQCVAAGVPFFMKQWGEYYPAGKTIIDGASMVIFGNAAMYRVGKKAAGRMLDGREWSEFPEVQS